jgi:oligopeptide/dipeptide ABC transporter ATP-binding protein
MAFILITHDLGIIAETVEEVAVMYAGRVVEQASTVDLFERPRHPYTRALLKSLPSLERKERLQTIPGSVPDLAHLPRGCSYQDRCEKVQAKCRDEEPDLFELAPHHRARCFFPYD